MRERGEKHGKEIHNAEQGRKAGKYGYASAISMVLFILVLIITLIQFKGASGEN